MEGFMVMIGPLQRQVDSVVAHWKLLSRWTVAASAIACCNPIADHISQRTPAPSMKLCIAQGSHCQADTSVA